MCIHFSENHTLESVRTYASDKVSTQTDFVRCVCVCSRETGGGPWKHVAVCEKEFTKIANRRKSGSTTTGWGAQAGRDASLDLLLSGRPLFRVRDRLKQLFIRINKSTVSVNDVPKSPCHRHYWAEAQRRQLQHQTCKPFRLRARGPPFGNHCSIFVCSPIKPFRPNSITDD